VEGADPQLDGNRRAGRRGHVPDILRRLAGSDPDFGPEATLEDTFMQYYDEGVER
jgi:hypothetical protein